MISHLNIIQFYQIEVNGTLENKNKASKWRDILHNSCYNNIYV